MDLSKLSTSDKVIAGSGIVLFLSSFFTWFELSIAGIGTGTRNGWDVGFLWGPLPALLGLLAAGIVIATKMGNVELPELPVSYGKAMLIVGAVAAALVVLKLLMGDDVGGFDLDRAWGLYVATLAALGLLAGGYLAFQEERPGAGPR